MIRRSIDVPGLGHGSNPVPAASRVGPLLATGAVRGVDRQTGSLPDEGSREVDLAFENLEAVICAGGAGMGHVVHVNVFLGEADLRAAVNAAWARIFPEASERPARHLQVQPLPGGMRLQLEALAFITDSTQEY